MYAEDIALWTTGSKLGNITSRMQKQLNETAKFLFANGFKLSSSKSQAVLFSRNRIDANVKFSIGNELLPLSNTATFLGIELDERLTWSAHAQTVEQRCLKRLNALRAISGSSWGASRSSLLQVYQATIRSVLYYAKQLIWETNESRASTRRSRRRLLQSAAAACMEPALHHYRWNVEILHTIFADRSSWRIVLSEQLQIITKQAIVIFF